MRAPSLTPLVCLPTTSRLIPALSQKASNNAPRRFVSYIHAPKSWFTCCNQEGLFTRSVLERVFKWSHIHTEGHLFPIRCVVGVYFSPPSLIQRFLINSLAAALVHLCSSADTSRQCNILLIEILITRPTGIRHNTMTIYVSMKVLWMCAKTGRNLLIVSALKHEIPICPPD